MSTSVSKHEPKKLFLTFVLVMIVLLANLAAIIGYRQRNLQSFLAAFAAKQELLQNTPSPRVILVGGSSVAYGFDSTALAQKVGVPVVNMGLQGGLGLRFELESLKSYIKDGDIIVLSPEYHNLLGKLTSGEVLSQIVVLYPKTIRYFTTLNEFWQVIRSFPAVHTLAIKNMLEDLKLRHCLICPNREPIYYLEAFDLTTGDVINNESLVLKDPPTELNVPYPKDLKGLTESINLINDFKLFAETRKAAVFFYYPSTINIMNEETSQILKDLDKKIREELTFPVLNSIANSQYPLEYMFDTAYHLNKTGRALNTQRLGELLCQQDQALRCK